MPLRIGFDLDGVLADLASAYAAIDRRLFGSEADADEPPDSPVENGELVNEPDHEDADPTVREATARLRERRRRGQVVWHAIETTEGFWATLAPAEPGIVERLARLAERLSWEVFFVTRRPETAGETTQRQTQRWLAAQGFELPSVVVVRGSRGKLADALGLDYLVDDTPQNCVDVVAESTTRVILVNRGGDPSVAENAARLGVAVVASAAEALDVLERATAVRSNPSLLDRLAKLVGWR